jgi:hypothetical protein
MSVCPFESCSASGCQLKAQFKRAQQKSVPKAKK